MKRYFYSDTIDSFLKSSSDHIFSLIAQNNEFNLEQTQRDAWLEEIRILKDSLPGLNGKIYFEYSIPRMGRRIDVILIIKSAIFVLEFKIGENSYPAYALDQVVDYALDLKNFHETSHSPFLAPILIATQAQNFLIQIATTPQNDRLLFPIRCNSISLKEAFKGVLDFTSGDPLVIPEKWEGGRYCPTPTIIEAAMALYNGHSVKDISRSDASAINLNQTSEAIEKIIQLSQKAKQKSICFVTGVPGAGKTLVGLNIANKFSDDKNDLYSVFLSGNGPLVAILREALARDKTRFEKERGNKMSKTKALSIIKKFIQNVHHFRDDCIVDERPPIEHVALFDEAQRAWNLQQTSSFMTRKKKVSNFKSSEPEFLISCMDRHQDWAVIICLVGGGQEINTGEAGIGEWIASLQRSFPKWHIYISSRLSDSEYGAGSNLKELNSRNNVITRDELHLAVSMRSFRAENVSLLISFCCGKEFSEKLL